MEEQSFLRYQIFPRATPTRCRGFRHRCSTRRIGDALAQLTDDETKFLGMGKPVTELKVRSLPAARNSQPYRNRRACAGNTNCIPICPIQAKYDPTITLNEATNSGARLIDHAVASEIMVENDRVSGINFITYKDEAGPKTGEGCVKAKIYVIAANAIETPRLLLMSKNNGRTSQRRGQQQRHGRAQSDGPSVICRLGAAAADGKAGISLSRPADHLGHRRSLRRSVPRQARRFPGRYRQ